MQHPKDCFCPRSARTFVESWLRKNKDWKYDFFHTPKGPVIFYRKDGRFCIKDPISKKWFTCSDFVLNVSETLAIAFGRKR